MTPLAQSVYAILRLRVPHPWVQARMTYGDLCHELHRQHPQWAHVRPYSRVLWDALGDIVQWCQSRAIPLPPLSSIVVNQGWDTPGMAYYSMAYPDVSVDDTPELMRLWAADAAAACQTHYP